jgi:putative ABC transport system permease protein
MFHNYLAAALRNLVRNRLFAAITIIGLAVGFAAALLIALYVRDELTYDHWIPGHERIYRVAGHIVMQGGIDRPNEFAPLVAADALKQEFPEIEAVTRLVQRPVSVGHGDREFQETLSWAEPNLLDVLPLLVFAGDPHTALADPDGVVLTRSLARKYFGRDTPIGETLDIDRQFPLRVTAVLEDLPSNTHLNFGVIASSRSARAPETARDTSNIDSIGYVYLRLAPGASVEGLRKDLPAFNDRHPEVRARRLPFVIDRIVAIADIHLLTTAVGAMKPAGNADTAYSALAIAILIMIVAGFNFVNLATARAARRAIEVGVRKVSGAQRRQLIAQFIGESIFYAVLGMFIAIEIATLLLPSFNGFLQRTIALDFRKDPVLLVAVLAIVTFVGVAAGAYPAFVLSRFSPATVLKGLPRGPGGRSGGRQVLVALQFAVLIVLALGAAAVHRQVRYATTEALRFDKDQMLLVTGACLPPLAAEIRALPGVRNMTCTMGPGLIGGGEGRIEITGPDGAKARSQMTVVDFGTFGVYGLKPVAGRLFSADFSGDAIPETVPNQGKFAGPSGVVIDEAMSRALGFATPAAAVGKTAR